MRKTIAVAISLAIGVVNAVAASGGAKKHHYRSEVYEACAELAEYVNRKERLAWERCLAKEHQRRIKGRAQR
jgi:hypothetical protein